MRKLKDALRIKFEGVSLALADVNKSGDGAEQVQQGVHFDGRLVRAKRCPRMHR